MTSPGNGELNRPPRGGAGELARGSSVGRYLILALLGKGGMGDVYAAYDPELDRKVALKLLRAEESAGGDPAEGRARLLREAQAIARLSDPNVVVVYDVGTFGQRVFLAMEFVDGCTLGFWMHAQPRSWREVLATFSAAGRGLAAAHRAGVVHRDFKPDNVMIDGAGKVRVMDFGLARTMNGNGSPEVKTGAVTIAPLAFSPLPLASMPSSAGPSANNLVAAPAPEPAPAPLPEAVWEEDAKVTRQLSVPIAASQTGDSVRVSQASLSASASFLTMTGAMMGTPAYMAPEQFRGGVVDARTDQFSFCVALYEGLYGERPFDGKNIHDQTAKVLKGVVGAAPLRARVPGWLRRVVLRGLRVEASDRHASMEALLSALQRDVVRRRQRWAIAGSAAGLITLLAAGLVQANRAQRTRCQGGALKLAGIWELPSGGALTARKEAIRTAFMGSHKPYAADSFAVIRKMLDGYVTEWSNMHRDACEATHARGEQSAEVLDLRMSCLNDRFTELRALVNVFGEPNGDVVSMAAQAAHGLRPVEPCGDVATLRAVVRPPDDPAVRRAVGALRTQLAEVKALTNAGRYQAATARIEQLTAAARSSHYQPLVAEALVQWANIEMSSLENIEGAEKHYEEAVWLSQSSRHDEVALEASTQLIWTVGYRQRRFSEGERWSRYSNALLERLGAGHEVIAGWRANNLATMLTAQGRYGDALEAALKAVALKSAALGAEHFDVAISLDNAATAQFRLGRTADALQSNSRALEILRRSVGPQHPDFALVLVERAEFLNGLGQHAEAISAARQSLAIWEHEIKLNHPALAYPLTTLGASLTSSGHAAAAVPYLERALAIRLAGDPVPELLADTRFALARALMESKQDPVRARSLLQQARNDYQQDPLTRKQMADVDRWTAARHVSLSSR